MSRLAIRWGGDFEKEGIDMSSKHDSAGNGDWKKHHGTASDGKVVHSLSSRMQGDRKILKNDAGRSVDGTPQEFEIFACDTLTELGYQVIPPAGAKSLSGGAASRIKS